MTYFPAEMLILSSIEDLVKVLPLRGGMIVSSRSGSDLISATPSARGGSVRDFLALERNVSVESIAGFIGVGFNAIWMPFIGIFMSEILGFGDFLIGISYTVDALAMGVMMRIGGYLSYRIGRKRTIITGRFPWVLMPILFLLSMKLTPYLSILAMLLHGVSLGLSAPAKSALIAESVRKERRGMALMVSTYVFPSLSPIAGAIIGGILANQNAFEFMFFLGAIGVAVMTLVEVTGLEETLRKKPLQQKNAKRKVGSVEGFILVLAIAYALDAMSTQAISWYVPLYVKELGFTNLDVGILYAILPAVIAVAALIGGKLTDSAGRYQTIIASWVGVIFLLTLFTITSGYYALYVTYPAWVSLDTIDNMAPVAWISDITQQENRASRIAFFQSMSQFVSIVGPSLGALTLALSIQGPFIMKIAIQVIALIMVLALVLRSKSRSKPESKYRVFRNQ
jgi:MFS family permease